MSCIKNAKSGGEERENTCDILGLDRNEQKQYCGLGYGVVSFGRKGPKFRRNMITPLFMLNKIMTVSSSETLVHYDQTARRHGS